MLFLYFSIRLIYKYVFNLIIDFEDVIENENENNKFFINIKFYI